MSKTVCYWCKDGQLDQQDLKNPPKNHDYNLMIFAKAAKANQQGEGQALPQMVLESTQQQKEMYYEYLNQHGQISD